jgi:hypothetical protein
LAELASNFEREQIGGHTYRQVQHIKPCCYRGDDNYFRRNVLDWARSNVEARPLAVDTAPLMVSVGVDGVRRCHPTRERDRWIEIGAPCVKSGVAFAPMNLGVLGYQQNAMHWTNADYTTEIVHGGHFVKIETELLNGWRPKDDMVAYAVATQGLTLKGTSVLRDGIPVAYLRDAIVHDADNPDDVRPVKQQIDDYGTAQRIVYTLPKLTGMKRPVLDPTLVLQPDAADGKDTWVVGHINYLSRNNGINPSIQAGYSVGDMERALILFDLSSIPTTMAVSSCVLSLCITTDNAVEADTYNVYRMKQSWLEGTGNFAATGNGATWLTYDGLNNWLGGAGGFGAVDCEQVSIATLAFTGSESVGTYKDFDLNASKVTEWGSGAMTNNGMMIRTDEVLLCRYSFASSDYTTNITKRPQLTVVYTVAAGHAMRGLLNRSIL